MANKKNRTINTRIQKQKPFEVACGNLKYFSYVGCALIVVAVFLFFLKWSYIYNTDISSSEVDISGWNCLVAGLTGKYASADAVYGDMSIPFYYYAKSYCKILSAFTVISFLFLIVYASVAVVSVAAKKYRMNVLSALCALLSAVFLTVCFALALSMNASKILPKYCGGNPACSIRSSAIIPALFCLAAAVLHIVAFVKYSLAETKSD